MLYLGRFGKSRNNARTGRNCNELHFDAANPTNGRQFVLQEQVIGFVIKAPLANSKRGTAVFALLDHLAKVLLFFVRNLLVLFNVFDIDLVLNKN